MNNIRIPLILFSFLLIQGVCCFAQGPSSPQPGARDYHAPLTETDKGNIRYLIMTLANKSGLSLLFAKSNLNRAGNAVAHVNPLVFFEYVFTDPQLKHEVKKINGLPWKRFVEGMGESFAKEAARNNITQADLKDFSRKVHVDYSILAPIAQSNHWEEFINVTRNHIH